MGILTDAFIAFEADLSSLHAGDGGPSAIFPTLQGKGIDPLKLAILEAILRGQETYTYAASIDEPLRDWGEEWVYPFSQPLVAALALLQPNDALRVAAKWAETDEWRLVGLSQEGIAGLARLVTDLGTLAQQALHEHKAM
jgi:hypothetical protein